MGSEEVESTVTVARRWKRLVLVGGLVLVALVAIGVSMVVHSRNKDAPLRAVREYVDAIARGDASAASALVDPELFGGIDRALLTDQVLASATHRIVVEEAVAYTSISTPDIVQVRVDYTLGGQRDAVALRARRVGATAGVLDNWRVIDPWLAPVRVETNVPTLATASLGAATIPAGGPAMVGFPERRLFVYPGIYQVSGVPSRYVRANAATIVASGVRSGARPANTDQQTVTASLSYDATPELDLTVRTRLAEHVTACIAAVANLPAGCPDKLHVYADVGNNFRLVQQPSVQHISSYQVKYQADGSTEPLLRFTAEHGRFAYRYKGTERTENFSAFGRIVVTPDDKLTITFTRQL